ALRIRCGTDVKCRARGEISLEDRYEHLPAYTLPRPFVQRVIGDPDDLDRQFLARAVAEADMPSDGALLAEEVPGELLIHNSHSEILSGIALIEVPALDDPNAHRLPVVRRDGVHKRLHVLAVLGLMSFHAHRGIPFVTRQNRLRGDGSGAN